MPKEATIAISKETLALVKGYQDEFGCKSLEEAVVNAIQWARLWYCVDVLKRRELTQRVSDMELEVAKLKKALEKTNKT